MKKDKDKDKDIITIFEYWPHEHMEVKLRSENFEKYIRKIGEARARFKEMKERERERRKKEKEDKDRDKT